MFCIVTLILIYLIKQAGTKRKIFDVEISFFNIFMQAGR